jgi:hypothetical protein
LYDEANRNGDVARVIVVAEDLLDELDRWSAYAQTAAGDAAIATRHVEQISTDVVRQAAFVANLTQQTDLERDGLADLVREATSAAGHAIAKLLARRESWRHAQQISRDAVATWVATKARADDDLVEGRARLARLQRRDDRITATLAGRRRSARRSRTELRDELVDVHAMVRQAEADGASFAWASQQAGAAIALAEQALAVTVAALDDVEHGLRSAELAAAHASAAGRSFVLIGQISGRQGESCDIMTRDAVHAGRAAALSGRLLASVDDAYNEAQLQWVLTRHDLGERVDDLRGAFVGHLPMTDGSR